MMRMLRPTLLALLAVTVLAPAAPAAESTLSTSRYGAVDFGDRIAYRIAGASCERSRARVVVTVAGKTVLGPASTPRLDAVDGSGCRGAANVPSFKAVTDAGWRQGAPIAIELQAVEAARKKSRARRKKTRRRTVRSSVTESVPLRFFRIEADLGKVAAGAPVLGPAQDQDTGEGDKSLTMSHGDSVSLGRVNLDRVEGMSLRICIAGVDGPTNGVPQASAVGRVGGGERIEPPTVVSIRQGAPDGPALIGPVDVSSNPTTVTRLATQGFGGCYRLLHLPITSRATAPAPELFVTVDNAVPGVLQLNSVDITGTAAKLPAPPEKDPASMKPIFDGTTWDGWAQSGCQLHDGGSVSNLRTGSATEVGHCRMDYGRPLKNVVYRFDVRRRDFLDNGGIMIGEPFPAEFQLRSAGEWGPGGLPGQYAARAQKLNTWPDWSQVEFVQLGARYVVTINGRTVTDVVRSKGAPGPWQFGLESQPEWSFRAGASNGFGRELSPDGVQPSEWGDFWFRNIRVLECASESDPACTALANARLGQAPSPGT